MARFRWITALGLPVVPEVNISRNGSSEVGGRSTLKLPDACSISLSKRRLAGASVPTTTMCFKVAIDSVKPAKRSAVSSSTTSTLASECSSR